MSEIHAIEPGTTIHVRYLPEIPEDGDPIPWSYWATDDNGDSLPDSTGWAGTYAEAVEYCAEKIAVAS
jgi:hypothetical protein